MRGPVVIDRSMHADAQRTRPVDAGTSLALSRTLMALDRTLMAWIRTGTSLISFGFTIYKFFQYVRESEQAQAQASLIGPRGLAMIMIGIGIGSLLVATLQHRRDLQTLRTEYGALVPGSLATVTAGVIAALGVLLFSAVLLRL
jgi:putative membrane protein